MPLLLWLFLEILRTALNADVIMVSNDTSKPPCTGCIKTNSFLEALDRAFRSQDINSTILLEDKIMNIDSKAINLYLTGASGRTVNFSESGSVNGKEIFVKGNIDKSASELVFSEQSISIQIKKVKMSLENIHINFKKQFNTTFL